MRIIVGVSGASGSIIALELLKALKVCEQVETHLVVTRGAMRTLGLETHLQGADLHSLVSRMHDIDDIAASIASGSFVTEGMVVSPCSMKTLSGIVHGYSDNLLLRAADVCLKEHRRLVLVPREMPLSSLHLENMLRASNHGATIMSPMMTFYNDPHTIQEMIHHLVGKILMQFSLPFQAFRPWEGPPDEQ